MDQPLPHWQLDSKCACIVLIAGLYGDFSVGSASAGGVITSDQIPGAFLAALATLPLGAALGPKALSSP